MSKSKTSNQLLDMLGDALGETIAGYLQDPQVTEIMLNPDGKLWIDKFGCGLMDTGLHISPIAGSQVISLVASAVNSRCNELCPILEAELPGDGSRFEGILPPNVAAPTWNIRKHATQIFALEDYVASGIITEQQYELLIRAAKEKLNILVVGSTGSGKTTFVNALLKEIAKTNHRVVIIQDTLELQCAAQNVVYLRTKKENQVSMEELLRATLRLRPDRIVVGEVRGGEALTLLKAWTTGHPGGCSTIHASSALGGLKKLEQYILEKLPNPQRELIAEAVDVVVFIERYGTGRRVKEILAVTGYDGQYLIEPYQ